MGLRELQRLLARRDLNNMPPAPTMPPSRPSLRADEPTSGLDSYTADEVMTVVKVGRQPAKADMPQHASRPAIVGPD